MGRRDRATGSTFGRTAFAVVCAALVCSACAQRAAAWMYSTLDGPLGQNGTFLSGISNGVIAGNYWDPSLSRNRGFRYSSGTYTLIDYRGFDYPYLSAETYVWGISGNVVVGRYGAATH